MDPTKEPAMKRSAINRTSFSALLLTLAAALLAPTLAGARAPLPTDVKVVAKTATSPSLEKTVLTNLRGRTLYTLSAERNGKFICTGSCLSIWHPLTIQVGVKPKGPVALGTVKRPDGRTQVTFKGRPLYRFNGDTKKGDANGEGFKDVGTWHAAVLAGTSSAPPPPPPTEGPYGY
jgi:predicted lipoprotein with Yx(FWY)xxD motif